VSAAHDPLDRLDDDAVVRYLREHPEFFARHPRLLADLRLPHEAGKAVSLVERQVSLLRERNIDTRKRLALLLDTAHANDALFEKTRTLTLALLDARTLDDIDQTLGTALKSSFDADHVACHYAAPVIGPRGRHLVPHESSTSLPLVRLANGGDRVVCGAIRADEYRDLFGESAGDASAALVGMQSTRLNALLAIGSRNPARFSTGMGPLFVRYIGDVLVRVLGRALDTFACHAG
jgi:uncharacterized protein YigA (DUF484 family)